MGKTPKGVAFLFDDELSGLEMVETCCRHRPAAAVVLGSGLGSLAAGLDGKAVFPFESFPSIRPGAAVEGHAGRISIGRLGGVAVGLIEGRRHLYEGSSAHEVTFPVRLMAALGVRRMILTNAAGGVNPELEPGGWMMATGALNLTGVAVREGFPPVLAERRGAWIDDLGPDLPAACRALGLRLEKGVYASVLGPNYETRAEGAALRAMGADAVGMSTVLEAASARACGVDVACFSCITNQLSAPRDHPLTHEDVLAAAGRSAPAFMELLVWLLTEGFPAAL